MDFVNWRHEYPFLATFLPQICRKKKPAFTRPVEHRWRKDKPFPQII